MQITQRQLGHVEFVYAAEMATRTLWNSGHFLPSPRQENLLQDGVSSLNPTFLTSFSPSLRDVMRRIIKATQNFRRVKKAKTQIGMGRKGSLETSHLTSCTRLSYLQHLGRLIKALFSLVLKAPTGENSIVFLGTMLHCFTNLKVNYFAFVSSHHLLYWNFLQLPLLYADDKSMVLSSWESSFRISREDCNHYPQSSGSVQLSCNLRVRMYSKENSTQSPDSNVQPWLQKPIYTSA